MAYSIPDTDFGTLLAATDLSTNQYFAVAVDVNGEMALVTNPNIDSNVGVVTNQPKLGEPARVRFDGVVQAVAGAAIAAGAVLGVNASGKFITHPGAAEAKVGTAVTAAAVDGEVISIQLGRTSGI